MISQYSLEENVQTKYASTIPFIEEKTVTKDLKIAQLEENIVLEKIWFFFLFFFLREREQWKDPPISSDCWLQRQQNRTVTHSILILRWRVGEDNTKHSLYCLLHNFLATHKILSCYQSQDVGVDHLHEVAKQQTN